MRCTRFVQDRWDVQDIVEGRGVAVLLLSTSRFGLLGGPCCGRARVAPMLRGHSTILMAGELPVAHLLLRHVYWWPLAKRDSPHVAKRGLNSHAGPDVTQ